MTQPLDAKLLRQIEEQFFQAGYTYDAAQKAARRELERRAQTMDEGSPSNDDAALPKAAEDGPPEGVRERQDEAPTEPKAESVPEAENAKSDETCDTDAKSEKTDATDEPALDELAKANEKDDNQTDAEKEAEQEHKTAVGGVGASVSYERDGTKKNKIIPSVRNILKALRSQPDYEIRYDEFFNYIVLVRKSDGVRRAIKETDYNKMQEGFEIIGFKTPEERHLRSCVARLAEENSFDSLKEWVAALPEWDRVSRIDGFFTTYCGVQSTPYTVAAARYLWTALAGRACEPGIKADGVIVLLGEQGIGKTSLVYALAPMIDDVSTAGKIALDTKDADTYRKMQGKIVCEIPELRGFRTRDEESIKDFLSATEDEWVPKYKELAHKVPRRPIFIATGNEREFLKDPTGNRRWFPVEVTRIDLQVLRHDLLQLWAEAVHLFHKDGVLYEETKQLATDEHEKYVKHSELHELIEEAVCHLEKTGPFKLEDLIYMICDGKGLMEISDSKRKEVCAELRLMGYDNPNLRYEGIQERRWKRKT